MQILVKDKLFIELSFCFVSMLTSGTNLLTNLLSRWLEDWSMMKVYFVVRINYFITSCLNI